MSCLYPGYEVTADPSPARPARHVDTQLFSHFHTNLQKLDTCCCSRAFAAGKAAPDVLSGGGAMRMLMRWTLNHHQRPCLNHLYHIKATFLWKYFGSKIIFWDTFSGSLFWAAPHDQKIILVAGSPVTTTHHKADQWHENIQWLLLRAIIGDYWRPSVMFNRHQHKC